MRLTRGSLGEVMRAMQLDVSVELPDALGDQEQRQFSLTFREPGDFKMKSVVAAVPELRDLSELAGAFDRTNPDKRPSIQNAIEQVVSLVGEGTLAAGLRALENPEPESAAAGSAANGGSNGGSETGGGVSIDAIFDKAEVKTSAQKASSAVSAFVSTMRKNAGTQPPKTGSAKSKAARRLLEDAVYAVAADILQAPEVTKLERTWLGIKQLLANIPTTGDLDILLLDSGWDAYPQALEALLPDDPVEWPDCFFLLEPCDDPEKLREVAALCEGLNVPAVVAAHDAVFGEHAASEAAHSADELAQSLPDGWEALRAEESSRWLSMVLNGMVVVAEGSGQYQRVVVGSPALTAASLLSRSFSATGSFGMVFGPKGGMEAPAVQKLTSGQYADTMVPTADFISARSQSELAGLGFAAFGSARNSDKVLLANWPTLCSSGDAFPLPAQIIAGRIVRFAIWVRDQLPPSVEKEQVPQIFEDAAAVFLFPGIREGAKVTAELVDKDDSSRELAVGAQVSAPLAGIPLMLAFPLPLPGATAN